MNFQPLTGSAESSLFSRSSERKRQRFILDQLAERVKNDIDLAEYWTDKDDLAIVTVIREIICEFTHINAPLLPDDRIRLVVFVVDPHIGEIDTLLWAEIFLEIEDRRNCKISNKDIEQVKTVADFVAVIKSAPERMTPIPQRKAKARLRKIGCLTVLGIMALIISCLIIRCLNGMTP